MTPEELPRDAATVAAIDALIDEQIRLGERWDSGEDRCPICGGQWHGLTGDGAPAIVMQGTHGAEAYVQTANGGAVGCPGPYAISAARIRWRYGIPDCDRRRTVGWADPTARSRYVDQVAGIRQTCDGYGPAPAPRCELPGCGTTSQCWQCWAGPARVRETRSYGSGWRHRTIEPAGPAPRVRYYDTDYNLIGEQRPATFPEPGPPPEDADDLWTPADPLTTRAIVFRDGIPQWETITVTPEQWHGQPSPNINNTIERAQRTINAIIAALETIGIDLTDPQPETVAELATAINTAVDHIINQHNETPDQ